MVWGRMYMHHSAPLYIWFKFDCYQIQRRDLTPNSCSHLSSNWNRFKMTMPDPVVPGPWITFSTKMAFNDLNGLHTHLLWHRLSMHGTRRADEWDNHSHTDTLQELAQFFQAECQAIPQHLINRMPQCCADCLQARGGFTRYWHCERVICMLLILTKLHYNDCKIVLFLYYNIINTFRVP